MSDLPAILGGNPIRSTGAPVWPPQDPEIAEIFQHLFESGEWGRYHGPHCQQLEEELRKYFGLEHVHLCASGTAAVELALKGAGVSAGDEVILSAYDFKANFTNILQLEAIPVLVDVELDSWMINLEQLKPAVTEKTKAVILSHLHGKLVDIQQVKDFCREHKIVVIEDVCQSPGAKLNDIPCGKFGDISVLSFGGSKLLTAGRGGAVLTDDAQYMQRIQLYQQRGNIAYPLSEMQAAVIVPQLKKLDQLNQQRYQFISRLALLLNEMPGLKVEAPVTHSSYYKFPFLYDEQAWDGLTREQWINTLKKEGIGVDLPFRSLHLIHSAKRFRAIHDLPQATKVDHKLIVWHHPVFLGGTAELLEIHDALMKVKNHLSMLLAYS